METTTKHTCIEANAPLFLKWFRERGGIAVWDSINLASLGKSWTTPANKLDGTPMDKPTWEAGNTPRIITYMSDVEVITPREVKRFHVTVRMSGNGMSLKCSDGATRRIRKEVDKAGDGAWYEFDYDVQDAVIYVSSSTMTLADWAKKHTE